MQTVIDDSRLKEIFKQAIIEAIEEKRETVHDLLVEAMEDVAMIHAIQEGEDSGAASRKDVFKVLERKA
jgi:Arc/MetJ family transcription regulator